MLVLCFFIHGSTFILKLACPYYFNRDDNVYITLDFAFAAESKSGFYFIRLGSKECP
jgi:hypothetical protein